MILVLVCALNIGISYWNARVCGLCWRQANGGIFSKVLIWSAAIQSAVGFTVVQLFIEAGVLRLVLPHGDKIASQVMALGYLGLIVPAIGSGLVITVHSWVEAYRRRDLLSVGSAAYNTVAMGENISSAGEGITSAWSILSGMFTDDGDEDGLGFDVVAVLVIAAFLGGIGTTYCIVRYYMKTLSLESDTIQN